MKKSLVVSLLMLISILILGGCSGASWYARPNTTDAQTNRDYEDCSKAAEAAYPEEIVREQGNTTTTECTTNRGKATCTSKIDDVSRDINFSRRNGTRVKCMKIKGYKGTSKDFG